MKKQEEIDKALEEQIKSQDKMLDGVKEILSPLNETTLPETPHTDPLINMADYFARRIKR
jgi:hypothetical protein